MKSKTLTSFQYELPTNYERTPKLEPAPDELTYCNFEGLDTIASENAKSYLDYSTIPECAQLKKPECIAYIEVIIVNRKMGSTYIHLAEADSSCHALCQFKK